MSAYRSRLWADTFSYSYGQTVRLSGQHRQGAGAGLRGILERMRYGKTSDADIAVLNGTWGTNGDEKWLELTHLRARNADAMAHNKVMLANLPADPVTFQCVDTIQMTQEDHIRDARTKLGKLAPPSVVVCVGTTVVLTRTLSASLTAGAHGKVNAVDPGVCHGRLSWASDSDDADGGGFWCQGCVRAHAGGATSDPTSARMGHYGLSCTGNDFAACCN